MNRHLVSVIIPCFNQGQFLREAVASVQKQTYQDFEIVIVNDGSTDATAEVAAELAASDPRILYSFQENQGLAKTRNTGFAKSHGTFIQFLDADDLIAADKLYEQMQLFDAHPDIDVVYSNYQTFSSETGQTTGRYSTEFLGKEPLEDFLFKWERGLSIPIHAALFKRSVFGNALPFREELRAKEDWVMWVSIALSGSRFAFIDKDFALYRMHGDNMCRDHCAMMVSFIRATYYIESLLPDKMREHFIEEALGHLRFYVGCETDRVIAQKEKELGIEGCITKLDRITSELHGRERELDAVYHSLTYRIGRAVTWLPDTLVRLAGSLFSKGSRK